MCRRKRYVYWSNRREHALYPFFLLLIFFVMAGANFTTTRLVNSLSVHASFQKPLVSPVKDYLEILPAATASAQLPVQGKDEDIYVGNSIDEFFPNDAGRQSEMRMIMHCLLFHESRHGSVKGYGDHGMAGGPLQFWQDTWVSMRQQMISQGLAIGVGDRLDTKEAIRTTVWAIKNGRGTDWGPILRESEGSNWNACPVPSWY